MLFLLQIAYTTGSLYIALISPMTSDSSDSPTAPIEHLTIVAAPGLFVILWASGFIGAKLGIPYAQPLTFLFLRMFGAVLLLGAIVLIARPKWPNREAMLDSCANGRVHACSLSWRGIHFDRKWSSRSAIGA